MSIFSFLRWPLLSTAKRKLCPIHCKWFLKDGVHFYHLILDFEMWKIVHTCVLNTGLFRSRVCDDRFVPASLVGDGQTSERVGSPSGGWKEGAQLEQEVRLKVSPTHLFNIVSVWILINIVSYARGVLEGALASFRCATFYFCQTLWSWAPSNFWL